MKYTPASLYRVGLPADFEHQLESAIDTGCKINKRQTAAVFFRADDIGVPSAGFSRLISLFKRHRTPLCLAVVPSWLTARRFADLHSITGEPENLWCWHQHGTLHRNFEAAGKNQEFGPARNYEVLKAEIEKGRSRLQDLLGNIFEPFFTPPWNRCSQEAARALRDLGFLALSRSKGAKPNVAGILPDIQVNVDLHTGKQPDPAAAFTGLLADLTASLASGNCGIMLHHQRRNRDAFFFLDVLLRLLNNRKEIELCLFREMLSRCSLVDDNRSD